MKKMKTKTNLCLAKKSSGVDGKTLRNDERAVSAVIGVILMIAITVVIAAVVAAFAYGIIGGVKTAPSSSIVIENARADNTNITVLHHGGDTITDAFSGTGAWKNIEVKVNGKSFLTDGNASLNADWDPSSWGTNFAPGDELEINVSNASLSRALSSDDTIAVVYIPSGDIMQRVNVA
jgi:flagellin-like protein